MMNASKYSVRAIALLLATMALAMPSLAVAQDEGASDDVGAAEAAVTVTPSHVVHLAFHRDAFALAMRPLSAGTQDLSLGNQILSMTDAETGISLRLEISRQYKQTVWEFDVLWGVKLVRPELAVRIAG